MEIDEAKQSIDSLKRQKEYVDKQKSNAKTEGDWTKNNNVSNQLDRRIKGEKKPKDEEAVDTGDVEDGLKTQYMKCVKPIRKKNSLLESIGCYEEEMQLDEDVTVTFSSKDKIATMTIGEEVVAKCHVTESEWKKYPDEVAEFLGGVVK